MRIGSEIPVPKGNRGNVWQSSEVRRCRSVAIGEASRHMVDALPEPVEILRGIVLAARHSVPRPVRPACKSFQKVLSPE